MNSNRSSAPLWPSVTLVLASIPIVMTLLAFIQAVISEVTTTNGVYDVTYERAAFFGGLYLAIPCGLIAIIVGGRARSRGWVNNKTAIAAMILGGVGVFLGLVAWVWFAMISAFVF